MEKAISVNNHTYAVEFPDKCPLCHRHGDFAVLKTHALPQQRGVEVVFECPWQGCKSYFIGYYGPNGHKELKALRPQRAEPTEITEAIAALSPNFVAIYTEAEEARHLGLNQICGPGYRKAFEFLIKDYAKFKDRDRSAQIERLFSGNVVREFVIDPRIEAVATRALWLGNDESHYLRKWSEHDVNDLIVLIRLMINWIEIEQLSEKYRNEMPGNDV